MTPFPLTTIATVLALLVYFGLGIVVGRARGTYGVAAPATTGNVEFEKRYRVHMNTLEVLALLLPAAWLGIAALGDAITAALVLLWCVGRIVYARAYFADPTKRSAGFGLSVLPIFVMLIAALVSGVQTLMAL